MFRSAHVVSGANNDVSIAEFDVERAQKAIDKGKEGAQQKMDKAKPAMATARQNLAEKKALHVKWYRFTSTAAISIAIFLLIDAFLLPGMLKKCAAREAPDEAALAEAAAKKEEFERLTAGQTDTASSEEEEVVEPIKD